VLRTNRGNIAIKLLNSRAPCTVNSFVHLAEAGFYDNTQCHRLVTSGIYVLQCGDPYATASAKLTCSSTGLIGTGTPGYEFASENLAGATYPAGTLAMANEGTATSNGSQFFIVYSDSTSGLAPAFTPFGTVSSGLDIVQNVAEAGYSCEYALAGGGAPKGRVGEKLPRPVVIDDAQRAPEDPEVTRIRTALLAGVSAETSAWTDEERERLRDLGDRVVREGAGGSDPATALLLRRPPDAGGTWEERG